MPQILNTKINSISASICELVFGVRLASPLKINSNKSEVKKEDKSRNQENKK